MENFESGDFIGFYSYSNRQARHSMELSLQFQGGEISGGGMDDVGRFSVSGSIAGDSCSWLKSYDSHSVDYQGCLEGGKIWGTWSIAFGRGGFMIWPRSKGGPGAQEESPNARPLEEQPTQPLVQVSRKS